MYIYTYLSLKGLSMGGSAVVAASYIHLRNRYLHAYMLHIHTCYATTYVCTSIKIYSYKHSNIHLYVGNLEQEIDIFDQIDTDNEKFVVHKSWPRYQSIPHVKYFEDGRDESGSYINPSIRGENNHNNANIFALNASSSSSSSSR